MKKDLENHVVDSAQASEGGSSTAAHTLMIVKVRAGFYRVGALCIHKGHRWCVYHQEKLLPVARFRTLQEAAWWAHDNQPPAAAAAIAKATGGAA